MYSLWIVDAANNWQVVDSYDLEEYEHGAKPKPKASNADAKPKSKTIAAE